jgi:hypothetical protein
MLKHLILFFVLLIFTSCNNSNKPEVQTENQETKQTRDYKPGFGEFMTYIQIHHAKLWFAGKNQNWKLAEFELDEITETVEAIKTYQKEREESKVLQILDPAVDSVKNAIQKQSPKLFIQSFTALTNTCNTCHKAVKFEFNVVKIPDTPPFSNQDFSKKNMGE